MLKRMRWLMMGAGLGAGASLWLQRRLRALTDRYAPIRGTANALGAARQIRRDLRKTWRDSRRQMQDAEQRLRDERDRRFAERAERREQHRQREYGEHGPQGEPGRQPEVA